MVKVACLKSQRSGIQVSKKQNVFYPLTRKIQKKKKKKKKIQTQKYAMDYNRYLKVNQIQK